MRAAKKTVVVASVHYFPQNFHYYGYSIYIMIKVINVLFLTSIDKSCLKTKNAYLHFYVGR